MAGFRVCEGSVSKDDYIQHYTLCYDPQSRMLSLKVISTREIEVRKWFFKKERQRWECSEYLTFDADVFVMRGEVRVNTLIVHHLDDIEVYLRWLEPVINEIRKLRQDPAFMTWMAVM